jgi:hypothetical protein
MIFFGRVMRVAVALVGFVACSDIDTRYYKDRVDSATMDQVMHRYGPPHKSQSVDKTKTVWTYYERGSGTASYSGMATGGYCHAYVLTFDNQSGVLKDWRLEDCGE